MKKKEVMRIRIKNKFRLNIYFQQKYEHRTPFYEFVPKVKFNSFIKAVYKKYNFTPTISNIVPF